MIKKLYIKKLIVCFIVLFTILLLYLFPSNINDNIIKEELNYVDTSVEKSTIFLLNSTNLLASTNIITKEIDQEKKAKELLESLIIGSSKQDNIPNGFRAIIPSNTQILNISYNNNTIKVDFNKELMNTNIELEEKIIEAIVYTLTSIDNIENVIIYIEGELLTKLPQSKINLPPSLNRNFGINKEYNIISKNNISKTTIYYVSKNNNETYYVPVTKVNNDTRKKIEIIIDELSSNNIYKTNLMSYLNSNTKIISVNENEEVMQIDFNNAIFNDLNNKKILEEVLYTISLSINDNYDIDTIIFNVENEEIYKTSNKTIE